MRKGEELKAPRHASAAATRDGNLPSRDGKLPHSRHIPTVFVAFVRFWHVLRSAVLHLLLRDHFIQITETTNNDPYSSSPQHLGTRIFDRHFSGIHITIHTNHRLIHASTPTAFLCGGIKKDLHLSRYLSMQAQKRHQQRRG
ncbi:uncharacterized protein K441DRAFT_360003 [Cenococcum geophilum 1.58]|uniref:Uncharacterized protein n=1 Tax=Cenococcum geophilum 1.58 TaxID=794803 RepID=A0ACC8ELM1_9PEZI|nr:hypothetical protein K441DRAFT_360003 [Cenococcum geophilum 1.58]